ncbi:MULTISPECIES: PIG-L deacetylase family protein [Dactylosporangium]|uniref:LmbE family N-acetylglucosaminyl deacetylase n=2 Tax=Dactylosporangium TaxID=35753 RepID=A0A9W6KG12_9ACTN|nr:MULTISPECIES: PIG-L family deacetylase [Dactylosporangium]UAB97587.1 PIG-L family deacetylase [Dactylosporangium vinaceum]UWZ45851.1 PIG-L family deacetylase [Dactylosporangium matsuzakiense]GLL00064.1 hypothetical protein GCM10017581_018040 [Dactylosporangium matsuzakiense]
MNVLLLSPHPDDIAWSIGGTVARLAGTGTALSALTLFGRTTYAPASPAHGTTAAGGVRALEDAAWSSLTGVRLYRADLPDASLRGYDDDTEMGARAEPAIVAQAAERLAGALRATRPDLLLVPLAIRGHVDHVAARAAAEAVAPVEAPGCALVYYEDLPYAAGVHVSHTDHPVVVGVAAHHAEREAGVRCYPSQEPHLILPVISAHSATAGGERLWAATGSGAHCFSQLLAGVPAMPNTDAPLPRMETHAW